MDKNTENLLNDLEAEFDILEENDAPEDDRVFDHHYMFSVAFRDAAGNENLHTHEFTVGDGVTHAELGQKFADFLRGLGYQMDTFHPIVDGEPWE